jgi:hypothetical protein
LIETTLGPRPWCGTALPSCAQTFLTCNRARGDSTLRTVAANREPGNPPVWARTAHQGDSLRDLSGSRRVRCPAHAARKDIIGVSAFT